MTETPAPTNEVFDFARHVHRYMQDQITFADAKAGLISGIAGGLFVAYREVTHDWVYTGGLDAASVLRAALQLPFLLFVLLTVAHGYLVLAPRMPDRYETAAFGLEPFHKALGRAARILSGPIDLTGGGDLVRWPDIANRDLFPNTFDYSAAVLGSPENYLTKNLAEHTAVLARIVAEKFQHVRLALNYLVLAGLLVATLSLLGQLSKQ